MSMANATMSELEGIEQLSISDIILKMNCDRVLTLNLQELIHKFLWKQEGQERKFWKQFIKEQSGRYEIYNLDYHKCSECDKTVKKKTRRRVGEKQNETCEELTFSEIVVMSTNELEEYVKKEEIVRGNVWKQTFLKKCYPKFADFEGPRCEKEKRNIVQKIVEKRANELFLEKESLLFELTNIENYEGSKTELNEILHVKRATNGQIWSENFIKRLNTNAAKTEIIVIPTTSQLIEYVKTDSYVKYVKQMYKHNGIAWMITLHNHVADEYLMYKLKECILNEMDKRSIITRRKQIANQVKEAIEKQKQKELLAQTRTEEEAIRTGAKSKTSKHKANSKLKQKEVDAKIKLQIQEKKNEVESIRTDVKSEEDTLSLALKQKMKRQQQKELDAIVEKLSGKAPKMFNLSGYLPNLIINKPLSNNSNSIPVFKIIQVNTQCKVNKCECIFQCENK